MTDEQIVKALAENVMGLREAQSVFAVAEGEFAMARLGDFPFAVILDGHTRNWNPLTNDADACAVLDKIAESYRLTLARMSNGLWALHTFHADRAFTVHEDADRRRAISIGALRARGVEV